MKKQLPLIFFLAVASLGLWFGLGSYFEQRKRNSDPGSEETSGQRLNRFRKETKQAVLGEVTNAVVGITRIIQFDESTSDDNYTKWTSRVSVEYMNRMGGIERTNLNLVFLPSSGALHCKTVAASR